MSAIQVELTKGLQSVLAAPIYRPNDKSLRHAVGVLALDSGSGIEATGFDKKGHHGMVGSSAALIGSFLP